MDKCRHMLNFAKLKDYKVGNELHESTKWSFLTSSCLCVDIRSRNHSKLHSFYEFKAHFEIVPDNAFFVNKATFVLA